MYEDSWYNFVPDHLSTRIDPATTTRQRAASLLQKPNGSTQPDAEPLDVFEEVDGPASPPEADVPRRATSFSEFQAVVLARAVSYGKKRRQRRQWQHGKAWEALMIPESVTERVPRDEVEAPHAQLGDAILDSSHQQYLLYQDQLALTARHLSSLVTDSDKVLALLTHLGASFRAVDTQTSSFRARCEDLISEKTRLERLADDVGTDLHYYAYLDVATRRLNAPGAGRLVDDDDFAEMVRNLVMCIGFMAKHPDYRDAESYLARYQALLTKALHLLETTLTSRLDKISADLGRQIAATKSESAQHALAYNRYLDLLTSPPSSPHSSLLRNLCAVCRAVYNPDNGTFRSGPAADILANTAASTFKTYLAARDRDLRHVTQREVDELRRHHSQAAPSDRNTAATKPPSLESAIRTFIKQWFERAFAETNLFKRVFGVEPHWTPPDITDSVYAHIRAPGLQLPHPGNLAPLAALVREALAGAPLSTVTTVVGWLAGEHLAGDLDELPEDEGSFAHQCRTYAAQLLAEHLWPLADVAFEAEVTASIARGPMPAKIGKDTYPLVTRAVELLALYDQTMPKERAQKNSSVIFKIVRETIQVLQRAEQRLRIAKPPDPTLDVDLFMVKNLLVLKNELVALEIGDIRSQPTAVAAASGGPLWALNPGNLIGFVGSFIGGGLWPRGGGNGPSATVRPSTPGINAGTLTAGDMSEQLDELLRHHIVAFTQRWGGAVYTAQRTDDGGGGGGAARETKRVEAEVEALLDGTFEEGGEVAQRLREAIEMNAEARVGEERKRGEKRY